MTIEQTDLRRMTGISLMAIRRSSGEEIDYPNAQTPLEEGDRLLLVGQTEEISAFDKLASGDIAVPIESPSCQWLRVPQHSPIQGKTLSDLDLRRKYQIQVFAIRREGHFIQFPHGDIAIQPGDLLLLCGGLAPLKKIQKMIAPASTSTENPLVLLTSVGESLETSPTHDHT